MIRQIQLIAFFFISISVSAQISSNGLGKPSITPNEFNKWPSVRAQISDDGQRVLYGVGDSFYLFSIATGRYQKMDSIPEEFMLKSGISKTGFFVKKNVEQKRAVEQGVDIWSYSDSKLQSQQLKELAEPQGEQIFSIASNYALSLSSEGAENEWSWNRTSLKAVYLISKNGERKIVNPNVRSALQYVRSSYLILPSEKFVVYYDEGKKNYFSYEILTGIKRNLSSTIKTTWTTYVKRDVPMAPYMPIGIAGYIESEEAVLVYDQYDIFQLDPSDKKPAINLTNGYGRSNNIELRLALDKNILPPNENLILSGFNRVNKNDGFYEVQLEKPNTIRELCSQPYIYKGTWEDDTNKPVSPQKAKNANIYLVRRMRAEESPNYFWTKDFKTFNRITDLHPERDFNWLTTELITWKLPDGSSSQGILYKPENFDPKKKYPIIFQYYENATESLHGFPMPTVTNGPLNIPYYVSNGYLVFTPDMHYKIGHKGQSVVNTIVSAAKYLSRFSFVDSKHMGLQGHSRGGWQTDYIVTHTNIFAAAMSSSGFCDYVSSYNRISSPSFGANSRQSAYETGYQRIGASLWERPDLFIENSPVFDADKMTTPLLMMNNKMDQDIPFEQGIEFFTALRRLGKRVWMLQYDGEGHLVFNAEMGLDLETRMRQFFDHYLKDSACPRWMLYGIPASQKGIDNGYELVREKDHKTGKWLTPKEGGLLTDEEKKKVEALKHRKPVTITIK